MEIRRGKLIECFAITPNFNFSWMKFSEGTVYHIQFAWLRWYITLVINEKILQIMIQEGKLEEAKRLYETANADQRYVLESLFPELRGSEDERIRKALIDGFTVMKESKNCGKTFSNHNIPVADILAYLEKQGELKQKHFGLKAGRWYICHRAFCCRADHLTVKEGERFLCEKDNVVKGFVIKEPEKYFKEISAPVAIETKQKSDITDDCKITPYGEKRDFGYFDRQKSANKTPYPETLEKAIDLYYFSYGNGEGEFEHLSLEKFRDIVHTFVSDYGQKPWSEEDEQYLLVCKNALAKYQTTDKWDANIIFHWLENKIKFLRPQSTWKPSEEQMNGLKEAIEFLGCTKTRREQLQSLYEQLKKLREE